jgi:tRNA (pseudouridine54-N1)-methyltransferase
MRRFIVIGQLATASPEFSLDDLPSSSGRLDIALRCLRATLLVSHGLRSDAIAYLVLLGGPRAPRTVRVEGAFARYVRPDERSLAVLNKKALAQAPGGETFAAVRPGIAVADAGLDAVIADVGRATRYVLEEGAPDVRDCDLDLGDAAFFVGDHLGFNHVTRSELSVLGARPIGVGPVSIHADDAITIVGNELDRQAERRRRA